MANILDSVVIQFTEKSHGNSGGEERVIIQQHEDEGVTPLTVIKGYSELPAPEQAAFDTLKTYFQTQIDNA